MSSKTYSNVMRRKMNKTAILHNFVLSGFKSIDFSPCFATQKDVAF